MIYERQNDLIQYLVTNFTGLSCVKSLYIKGSIATENSDEYSDVDFYCQVDEKDVTSIFNARDEILEAYKPILYKANVNFSDPQVIVIYDNDLHLDFYITTEEPIEGNSRVKVLYDPNRLLSNYKFNQRVDNIDDIADRFSDVIYTFHELYIAYKRNDYSWALRLESHIIADLSIVLDSIYDKKRPVLHMKGVFNKIPSDLKVEITEVLELMTPSDILECTYKLICLTELILKKQDSSIQEKIDDTYLRYIKKKIHLAQVN